MNETIKAELEQVRQANSDGALKPREVLAFAKANEESAIHGWLASKGAFDADVAMRQYGLSLCRQLIVRVRVETQVQNDEVVSVRAYRSLSEDQRHGGGYRPLNELLSHEQTRAALVRDAMKDLRAVKKRHEVIKELADVWRAIELAETRQAS